MLVYFKKFQYLFHIFYEKKLQFHKVSMVIIHKKGSNTGCDPFKNQIDFHLKYVS